MRKSKFRKGLVVAIIVLFVGASVVSSMSSDVEIVSKLSKENPLDVNEGLVGYWSFDDGTATDNSGNGHNGIIHGAIPQDGVIKQALFFAGEDDYVEISDTTNFQFADQSLTFVAWIQLFDNSDLDRAIMCLGDNDGYPQAMIWKNRVGSNDGRISFQVKDGDTNGPICHSIEDGDTLPLNEWLHVACVVDWEGGLIWLYINAIAQDSKPVASFDLSDSDKLRLVFGDYSRWNPSLPHKYYGLIDEVRIYDRALGEEEILELYKEPFKLSIIFGKINNLNAGVDRINFQAEKLRVIQFSPLQFLQYTSNEKVIVLEKYLGILNPNRAIGFFRVLI